MYKHVKPFDHFEPEACTAFLLDENGQPRDQIAYFYFGEDLSETRFSFSEYIDLMIVSRGYWYWSTALIPSPDAYDDDFRVFGPKIFEDIDLGLFRKTITGDQNEGVGDMPVVPVN
jgi:hypothetical protein